MTSAGLCWTEKAKQWWNGMRNARWTAATSSAASLPLICQKWINGTLFTLKLDLFADGKFVYGEERDIEMFPDAVPAFPAPARKISSSIRAANRRSFQKGRKFLLCLLTSFAAPDASRPKNSADYWRRRCQGEYGPRRQAHLRSSRRWWPRRGADAGKTPPRTARKDDSGKEEVVQHAIPANSATSDLQWLRWFFWKIRNSKSEIPISSWDLQFWTPDHVTAKGSYSKPDGGSFVTLVDGAGDSRWSGQKRDGMEPASRMLPRPGIVSALPDATDRKVRSRAHGEGDAGADYLLRGKRRAVPFAS